jgi:hypothetical protein
MVMIVPFLKSGGAECGGHAGTLGLDTYKKNSLSVDNS